MLFHEYASHATLSNVFFRKQILTKLFFLWYNVILFLLYLRRYLLLLRSDQPIFRSLGRVYPQLIFLDNYN